MSQDLCILIFAPPIMTLVFLALSWSYGRSIRGTKPFTQFMKAITVYGALFLLGMFYIMSLVFYLHWPTPWIIVGSTFWGLLVVWAVWHHYKHGPSEMQNSLRPVRATLQGGLPTVSLLVCLVASAIEWEFVFEAKGHWWVALAWTAGAGGSIWLARRNRRATVLVALRAFFGLLVIGAIVQGTAWGLAVAAVAAVGLLLLWRLGRKPARIQDLKGLESDWRGPLQ